MKKELSKFSRAASITFVTQILQFALGIGSSIVIARALGPEGKGCYSLAVLLPFLLTSFGNLGIAQASVFHLGKNTYSPKEVMGNNITLSFLLATVCFFIGLTVILLFSHSLFPELEKLHLVLALFLIPLQYLLTFINAILLGLQRIKEFNSIGIIQSFMFLILLLILLLTLKFGVATAIAANILSNLVAVTVLFFLAKRITGVFHLSFNTSYFKDVFRYGFKVYLGNIIQILHYKIDIFLVNIFVNPIGVGFYSIAVALSEKLWIVSQSASIVLFPKVCSETDEANLKELTPVVCRNVLLITFVGSIILFFLGRLLIIMLYSEMFSASVSPFQALLIGAVTMSGWKVLSNDLYGRGKPQLNIYVSLVSVMLNIILNVLWIPKFGIVGAAWATSISYTFAFVTITIVYSRISGNNICNVILPQKIDFSFYRNLLKKPRNSIIRAPD